MKTIESLPNETLSLIFELVRGPLPCWELPNLHGPWKGSTHLASASLVCKLWRDLAQFILFKDVHLVGEGAARDWLESPARARFAVRALRWSLGPSGEGPLGDVLAACEGVHALALTHPFHHWDLFDLPTLAGLTSLDIFIDGYDPTPSSAPCPLRLSNLSLSVGSRHPPSPRLLDLVTASKTTLTTLHLRIESSHSLTLLLPLFQLVGPKIRHLSLVGLSGGGRDVVISPNLLATFTLLESLTLGPTEPKEPSSGQIDRAALNMTLETLPSPSTLQYLSILIHRPTPIGFFLDFFHHPSATSLVSVDFPHLKWPWDRYIPHQEFTGVLEECERRAIRVVLKEE